MWLDVFIQDEIMDWPGSIQCQSDAILKSNRVQLMLRDSRISPLNRQKLNPESDNGVSKGVLTFESADKIKIITSQTKPLKPYFTKYHLFFKFHRWINYFPSCFINQFITER